MQNRKQSIKVSRQKIEEVTSLVKKLQQLTGKKILFKESDFGEDDVFNAKNYTPKPHIKKQFAKLKERYGLLDAANEFVGQFGKTDVPTLMSLFDISEEVAQEVFDNLEEDMSDELDGTLDNEDKDQIERKQDYEDDNYNDEIDQPNSPFSDSRFLNKDDN